MVRLSAPERSGFRAEFRTVEEARAKAAELLGVPVDAMVEVLAGDNATYCYASQDARGGRRRANQPLPSGAETRMVLTMKSYALHEIETVEQAKALPSGTTVFLHNVSPASWRNVNAHARAIMDALEARAPLGWEHIQLDGPCRYDLLVSDKSREELLDERAEGWGYANMKEMLDTILSSEHDERVA